MKYKTFKHIYYISQKANLLLLNIGVFDCPAGRGASCLFQEINYKEPGGGGGVSKRKGQKEFSKKRFSASVADSKIGVEADNG